MEEEFFYPDNALLDVLSQEQSRLEIQVLTAQNKRLEIESKRLFVLNKELIFTTWMAILSAIAMFFLK